MNDKEIPLEQLESEYKQRLSKLQPLQARFVEEYLIDLNASDAAKRAGYSHKTAYNQGSRLCRRHKISSLVSLATEIRSRRTQTTQDWVLLQLREQYTKADEEKARSAANRALELIGQHLGMFGKGKDEGGKHLHLHKDQYVNYPPVPESVKEWIDQMKEIGYDAGIEPVKAVNESNPAETHDK